MKYALIFLFCLIGTAFGSPQGDLLEELLKDYNRYVHPGNHSSIGKLFLTILPQCMHLSMDGVMEGNVWPRISWNDDRLTWNPEDHSGIEALRISIDKLWKPDVTLYNRKNVHEVENHFNAIVYSSGKILYVPDMRIMVDCDHFNYTDHWGVHECALKFGSWTFDQNIMELVDSDMTFDINEYNEHCPLKIIDLKHELQVKTYSCCEEPYAHTEYKLLLQRKFLVTEKGPIYNPNMV